MDTIWKNDLPERFDPMTVKELRQSLRRGSFVVPFLVVQVLAVLATAAEFQIGASSSSGDFAGALNLWQLANSGPFWIVVTLICAVLMPLAGLVLMTQEVEEGNHELLQLTKLNRWKVVLGKFITLWGLCTLTFLSLMPYVVVRYLVGGIEWWHEATCALSVLGLSSILCAGAIGASAFRGIGARVLVFFLFLGSMFISSVIPLAASAGVSGGCGWLYHMNAAGAICAFTLAGLALGRSRLRMVVHAYEVKPSGLILGVLFFAPFVTGLATLMTAGWGGFGGFLVIALISATADQTPKAPAWVKTPPPNIPSGAHADEVQKRQEL